MIDAHTHIFHDRDFLPGLFAAYDLRICVVNITGRATFQAPMRDRWRAMLSLKERYPERVALCTTFDPVGVAEPGFAAQVISDLRDDIRQGAAAVKVWKDVGLELRDRDGSFVQVDDERFGPIWQFLAGEGVPVLAHIGEPRAAWRPLDARSPHFRYYSTHPQYHLYQQAGIPPYEAIIAARDRWLEANPALMVVGCHLGSLEHDVDEVARRLAQYPNFHVDTAERFGDLITQPSDRVRAFFLRYADRIHYGTDVIFEQPQGALDAAQARAERADYEALLDTHRAYLAGSGCIEVQDKLVEPITVQALGLPADVLRKVCHENAARLWGFAA